jgi:hypothetical protein
MIAVSMAGALAGAMALCGCGESGGESSGGATTGSGTANPPAWRLASMPESATDVGAAKQSAQEGDEVVIRGMIGGSREPIGKEAAYFTIVDTSIVSCADMGEGHCKTPWDYCCEPSESLKANQATVKLVDSSGTIMAVDLAKFDVKPGAEVVVVGRVAPRVSEGVLTIEATGLHLVSG